MDKDRRADEQACSKVLQRQIKEAPQFFRNMKSSRVGIFNTGYKVSITKCDDKIAMVHKLHLYTRGCLLGDEEIGNFENREIVNEGKPVEVDDTDWAP